MTDLARALEHLQSIDGLDEEDLLIALGLSIEWEFAQQRAVAEAAATAVEHRVFPVVEPEDEDEIGELVFDRSWLGEPEVTPLHEDDEESQDELSWSTMPSRAESPISFPGRNEVDLRWSTSSSRVGSPTIPPGEAGIPRPASSRSDSPFLEPGEAGLGWLAPAIRRVTSPEPPVERVEAPRPAPAEPKNKAPSRPRNTFKCGVCLEDQFEDDIARIDNCWHSFCRDCLREYIIVKVNEHRFPIFCPSCTADTDQLEPGAVTESLIQEIWIPDAEYEIFEEMQLSALSILVHCRRCQQSMHVARDDYDQNTLLTCPLPNCSYMWCSACQQPVDFTDPQHTCDVNSHLDNLVKESGWKYCPGCKTPIQKETGCNHMTCISPGCNINFCYLCGATIVRSALAKEINEATMNHYKDCRLFEDIPDRDVPP